MKLILVFIFIVLSVYFLSLALRAGMILLDTAFNFYDRRKRK